MKKERKHNGPRTTRIFLVPTDFSGEALRAAKYAARLCSSREARIVLLHVTERFHLGSLAEGAAAYELHRRAAEIANEKLQEWKQNFEQGISVEVCLKHGSPWHEIVAYAKRIRPDMIIMGSHGYTGLKHLAMGSTAERVVRYAHCSVLVVRGESGKG